MPSVDLRSCLSLLLPIVCPSPSRHSHMEVLRKLLLTTRHLFVLMPWDLLPTLECQQMLLFVGGVVHNIPF